MKLPPGKTLFSPRGRDPLDDTIILADAVAASDANLFADNGQTVLIAAGRRVPVALEVLREIVATVLVTARPVERDGKWAVAFEPVQADEMMLRTLLLADSKANGGLIHRLPRVSKPTGLDRRQEHEVRVRMARGEHARDLAREFGSDADALQQLVR